MKLLSSWFRINRTLGLAILVTAACCVLSIFGGLTRTASAQKAQPIHAPAAAKTAPARKVSLPVQDYVVSTSSGASIVPGTTDIGNHCDDCTTGITFPFPVIFYDQVFTGANVASNGLVEFSSADSGCCGYCIPQNFLVNTMYVASTDLVTVGPTGAGVFTSTSGTAPNRIFNIEWRARHYPNFGGTVDYNFEVRLYEGQQRIDFIYGGMGGLQGIGVQRDTGSHYTSVSCNTTPASGTQYTFTIPSLSSCIPAPENMISWWKGEGNADDSQDDNDGTLKNNAGFAAAEVGQGFSLNGDGQYVEIPSSPNLEAITGAITVDAWINPDNVSTQQAIVSKYNQNDTTGRSWALGINSDGTVSFGVQNGFTSTCRYVDTPFPIPAGVFTHVAGTFDPETQDVKIYINGVDSLATLESGCTATVSSIGTNPNTPVEIGWYFNFEGGYFSGIIDEVEIFNRALSNIEVFNIYNAGSFGKCPCTPAPDGMISWWRAESDAVDSKDGNDGTLENGAGFGPGEVGQAFSFNGDGSDVNIPHSPNLDVLGTNFSVDFWIKKPTNDFEMFVIKSDTPNTDKGWALRGGGDPIPGVEFVVEDGNAPAVDSNRPIDDGLWHHVAGVREGETLRIYIDGVLDNTVTSVPDNGNTANTAPLLIGSAHTGWGGADFNGLIDELEIFNRPLTDADVAAIFNAGSVGKCRSCTRAPGGMISWWPGNGNGNDVEDGNNLTFTNGETYGPGKVDQAFSFNGSNSASAGNPSNLNMTGSQVTIDAWINPSVDLTTESWFFGKSGDGTTRYAIEWEPGEPGTLIGRANTGTVQANFTPPTNTWTHVAVVYDGNANPTTTLYVNGAVLASGSPSSGNLSQSPALFVIGAFGDGGRNFTGLVDEVEVFDRALTQSEIQKIFDADSHGKCPCIRPPDNMIAWWPGDDNAADIIGGHNGTLNGADFAPGEVSDAFNFNGDGDTVSIPDSTAWNFGTGEFTFDFWARANPGFNPEISNRAGRKVANNINRMYALSFEPDPNTRNLDFDFNDGGFGLWVYWNSGGGSNGTNAIQVGSTGNYTDAQWHHFALTRTAEERDVRNAQGGNWTLYIDGAVAGTASDSEALDLSNGNNNFLGARLGQDNFWNGQIDEVEIFNRALRADEVAAIFNAGGAGKCKPQAPDLTATKTNNVGGNTSAGSPWTWKISVANSGASAANFTSGQTILNDNLPNNFIIYGSPSVSNVVNVTNSGSINCTIVSSNLTCTASGSTVSIAAGGSFDVSFTTVAGQSGVYVNPRAGGDCSVDPNSVVGESNETNNTCSDTVTVTGRPSPTPSPTPTPTPTPTPSPGTTGTDVDGNGTIAGPHGGQATFSMSVKLQKSGKRTTVGGNFSYNDPASHISINQSNISSLTINGNHAHFTGPQRTGRRGSTLSFTVDVTDNGTPGNNDFFSISLSNGYTASGNLSTGDLQIH